MPYTEHEWGGITMFDCQVSGCHTTSYSVDDAERHEATHQRVVVSRPTGLFDASGDPATIDEEEVV